MEILIFVFLGIVAIGALGVCAEILATVLGILLAIALPFILIGLLIA